MSNYKYPFSIDKRTKALLSWNEADDWIKIFKKILGNEKIRQNINFSEYSPIIRLKELYQILITFDINDDPFQSAVVQLLTEYYGKINKIDELCVLIELIGYTKPSAHFRYLESMATDNYEAMSKTLVSEDGFSIPLLLINSIFPFDTERTLLRFLARQPKDKQSPEYYQIYIRCIYKYGTQEDFNQLMENLEYLVNNANSTYVFLAMEEYVFYKKNFDLLIFWFLDFIKLGTQDKSRYSIAFLTKLKLWLQEDFEEFISYRNFYSILYAVSVFLGEKVTSEIFDTLLVSAELPKMYRNLLFDFLGTKSPHSQIAADHFPAMILFAEGESLMVQEHFEKEVYCFNSGINKAEKELYRRKSLEI